MAIWTDNLEGLKEYYQKYFVPSRGFEVSDMLADALGALLALPIFTFIKKYKFN